MALQKKKNSKKSDRKKRTNKKIAKSGTLIIIGGNEDKENKIEILKLVAEKVGNGRLIVATMASDIPDELWDIYRVLFKSLGVKDVVHLSVKQHGDSFNDQHIKLFENANAVFFTGGDQLKITSKIGGTPLMDYIKAIYDSGGVLAGTSAGASVMGALMLVGGENAESHKVGNWMMAPGLRFLKNIIVDQHFAQRGRIGRLLGAVSLNPGILGIGIDENTAIVVEDKKFKVIGSNAVYVVDASQVSHTNISEAQADQTMSMHNVILHVLGSGDFFDIPKRLPRA